MSTDLTLALDESELDELADILAERCGEDGLQLDAAHGLMTAVAVGPIPIMPNQWLPVVLNQAQPFEDEDAAERAVTLILRLYNGIVRDLETMSFEALLGQMENAEGDIEVTARNWCIGFSMGVDLASDTWEVRMREDTRLMDMLSPVITLAADEELFERGEEVTIEHLTDTEYETLLGKIGSAMIDVQQYWRENPPLEGEGRPMFENESDEERNIEGLDGEQSRPRKRAGHWLH